MGKWVKRVLIAVCAVVFIVAVTAVALFHNELSTLSTLRVVDDHPLYSMTYAGDYGFGDFLKTGAKNDRDLERFVVKRLLKGINIDLKVSQGGCTAFSAQNKVGQEVFGRNFDFDFAPAMLIRTTPKGGYSSISIVNLSFAGYDKEYLPKPYGLSSFLTLASPYLPFDGMNERGVAIALLAVPYAEPPKKPGQITLNTTTAIRLVLDKAANVSEAVALLKNYNYYFSAGVTCHYLIADRTGASALVEFLYNDIKVTECTGKYQIASNFIAFNGMNVGEGGSEFARYDAVDRKLAETGGVLDEKEAMALLSKVAIPDRCQWSVVYNLETLSMDVCVGEQYVKVYNYALK